MQKSLLKQLPALALSLFGLTASANDIEPSKEFYTVIHAPKQVVLDGDLSEWTGVPVLADPKFAIPKGSGAGGTYVLFEEYNGGTWTGPDDQTSAVQIVYDADNVYFGFVVTDDYHENAANSAWNGDSVQLMIANGARDAQVALYNYALGGVEDALGDVIVMHEAGPGGTEAVITRNSTTKKTVYEIKLPKEALGLTTLKGGPKFGLGMAINDGDELTPGQKGWGGLGAHSIVFGKTPSQTAQITLAKGNDIEPTKEYYTALKTTKSIVLDGKLDEWTGAPVLADPKFSIPKGSGAKGTGTYVLFEEYNGGTWTGPDDQTSAVQVVYDAENVYFGFVVTDEFHENAANSAWNGDSIQLMIASEDRTAQVALYNYALGGVEGSLGDVIVMHEAGPGGTEAVVTRDGATKKTYYEIKLPASALGMATPLDVGQKFGLGMAINDGDELTPGQKGWGGLGAHSIVFGKTPGETALVTLGSTVSGGDPLFLSAINPGISSFTFRANDKGASIVDPASAKLTLDGKVVTLTSVKGADFTDFSFVYPAAFAPNSTHTYSLVVKDKAGNSASDQGSFKITALKIGMNFGTDLPTDTDPPGSGLLATDVAGVPAVAQANWNNLSGLGGDGATVALRSDTGASTQVTVSWDSNNTWASTGVGEENNKFTGADRTLMTGYLDNDAGTTSHVILTGIPEVLTAGAGYDVYVYALGGVAAGRAGGYRIVDPAGAVLKGYVLATSDTNPTTYKEVPQNLAPGVHGVGTYIVFRGLKAPAITLEATTVAPQGGGNPPRAPINAVQLVPSIPQGPFSVGIKSSPAGVEITFTGKLQSATSVTGPFTDVNGATSPHTIKPTDAQRYYRSSH